MNPLILVTVHRSWHCGSTILGCKLVVPNHSRPELTRPIPIPLQPPLRSCRHDPPPRLGRRL